MKALAMGLMGAALWANEPCERHYQAELSKSGSTARFRIPPQRSQVMDAVGGAVGAQKVTKILWGRGFVTEPSGKTTEREFVCLLESDQKAVGVFLRPLEAAAPRLAQR